MCEPYVPPKIINATPQEDYTIRLLYEDGRQTIYDIKPLLSYPMYKALEHLEFFLNECKICHNFVYWNDDIDIAPELLRG